jgi:microcystin-dependent protein
MPTTPGFIQDNTVSYTAQMMRRFHISMMYDEGVLDLTSLKVQQRGAGANFSVDIVGGTAVVAGDDQLNQGSYVIEELTALTNKTVTAAPGSNSRYDLVVAQVNDTQAGGAAGYNWTFSVIAGTAAASPVVPALPNSAIPLARIGPIGTATASITTALITDLRGVAGRRCTPGIIEALSAGPVPSGWLLCDGSAVSRTTYARLFAHIGTTFGAGDGSTTFNLPPAAGRVLVNAGVIGSATFTAGATGGEVNHTLTLAELAAHNHTGATGSENNVHTHGFTTGGASADHVHAGTTDPAGWHNHYSEAFQAGIVQAGSASGGSAGVGAGGGYSLGGTGNSGLHQHTFTTGGRSADHTHSGTTGGQTANHQHSIPTEGGNTGHNNLQPYLVVAGAIIRT